MKVMIRKAAEDDLNRIAEWIAKDNESAARRMVSRIRGHINFLEVDELTQIGRPGFVQGTREMTEYPYIIVYRMYAKMGEIHVLSIVHGARDR